LGPDDKGVFMIERPKLEDLTETECRSLLRSLKSNLLRHNDNIYMDGSGNCNHSVAGPFHYHSYTSKDSGGCPFCLLEDLEP
jgi:hypothetical protein